MKRLLSHSALLAAVLFVSGCETTGDPTQGGLFGWSETKYRYREAEKVNTLQGIQADTATQQRRANNLSGAVDAERDKLR